MSKDLYLKILNELKVLDFDGRFIFHGNNEPLLDKRLCDLIGIARGLFPKNYFSMNSNGLCINATLELDLFNAGLTELTINNYTDNLELLPSVKNILNNLDPAKVDINIVCSLKNDFRTNRAGETLGPKYHLKRPLKFVCQRPLTELIIGYDGTVPLCCADALWKEEMGNATQNSLKEIWFSQNFDNIRRALALGDRSCTEICKVCDRPPDPCFGY